MQTITEQNKKNVQRFNKEVIEQGSLEAFHNLVADDVINHAAMPGGSTGPEGMIHFLFNTLRAGFSDINVEILDQVAEGDKVTSRKVINATHTGEIMGIPPSNKKVIINIIDIIRLRHGQYIEHWGISNFGEVIREVSGQ